MIKKSTFSLIGHVTLIYLLKFHVTCCTSMSRVFQLFFIWFNIHTESFWIWMGSNFMFQVIRNFLICNHLFSQGELFLSLSVEYLSCVVSTIMIWIEYWSEPVRKLSICCSNHIFTLHLLDCLLIHVFRKLSVGIVKIILCFWNG